MKTLDLYIYMYMHTLYLPDCWLEVSIWKVLRPATSAQGFLGFPVSKSEYWDGSPKFQIATACFSWTLPELNFLDNYFIFMYVYNNHCHRATAHLQLYIYIYMVIYYQFVTHIAASLGKHHIGLHINIKIVAECMFCIYLYVMMA